jgi:AAA family ATP:ADP antiporter
MASAAALGGWLQRTVPGSTARERATALWSFAYFFTLLAGYYVLRPLRDQMGIAGGTKNLPWLFTATFVSLLVAQPIYGALVARLPRVRFIPIVYHFFVGNLILFWLLLFLDIEKVIVARVFFVWVSVFNLFAVAVFWSFMADLFTSEQGKRLFGFIGAGGTAGALLGPIVTIWLSAPLGPVNLLVVAAAFLEVAVLCVHRIERLAEPPAEVDTRQRIGGSAFGGLSELIRSPYLLGVAGWVSLLSFGATIAYFAQANIVSGDAGPCHRRVPQAFRHRHCGRSFARYLCRGLRRGGDRAELIGRGDTPGRATLDEFCNRKSGAAGLLHRGWARGKIQGQEPDRRRDLSWLGRVVWLGL